MMVAAAMLIVRLYDMYGVAPVDRDAAKATAAAILNEAGVDLRWRDCTDAGSCVDTLRQPEVVIRLLAGGESRDTNVLGYSLVDVGHRVGTLATVFGDRVADLARLAAVDNGELLGLAMAHEVGHLLLGRAEHARAGLMRAHWTAADLQRRRPADWQWSRDEQAALRSAAAARSVDPNQRMAQLGRGAPLQ